jgi:hypothetical protein
VNILADIEAWALDDNGCNVYWLVGMAGTGKSTISHTFCEILERRGLLGASFFCSRASTKANDARFIIPTIAHALASASPSIKSKVVEAIEEDDALPESTHSKLEVQFNKLVRDPLQASIGPDVRTYRVVVIDAVDECTNLNVVLSLIKLILQSVHHHSHKGGISEEGARSNCRFSQAWSSSAQGSVAIQLENLAVALEQERSSQKWVLLFSLFRFTHVVYSGSSEMDVLLPWCN